MAAAVPELAGAQRTEDAQVATRLRLVIGLLGRQLRRSQVGGLSPSQLSALSSIDRHGPIRLCDLAAAERISPPTLTPIVASLDALGLISRRRDPDDGRQILAAPTRRGRALLDTVRGEYTARLARRIALLDRTDRRRLVDALRVLECLVEEDGDPN